MRLAGGISNATTLWHPRLLYLVLLYYWFLICGWQEIAIREKCRDVLPLKNERIGSRWIQARRKFVYRIPSKYSTPSLASRYILLHTQILHFSCLKQHSLINNTLNMNLNYIECYFNVKYSCKIGIMKFLNIARPQKLV